MDTLTRRRRRCLIAGTPINPLGTLPSIHAPGHDQHPSRTFQDTSTQEGRTKPPTRARSESNGPGEHCTDAHAETTSASRHERVHIGTPIHSPCFSGHIDSQGCYQYPADMPPLREWIGQCCTDYHQHQPTLPSKPPDSAPHRTSDVILHKPTHPPLKAFKLSPTREIRSKLEHHTHHVAPARSAETTSTPPPHHRIVLAGCEATTDPGLAASPPTSPSTHTAACRNGPPAHRASNLPLLRTFPDERHATGARVGVDMP